MGSHRFAMPWRARSSASARTPRSWKAAYLVGIERILAERNSAERQIAAFDATGDVAAVAAGLVAETAMPAGEVALVRS